MRIPSMILVSTLALGGCAASIPPVQVTRFHLDGAIAPGTIALSPAIGLERQTYEAAVTRELNRLGFANADSPSARYVVAVDLQRDVRDAGPRRSPFSIGLGGGVGGGGYSGGGVGVGGGVSFPIGKKRSSESVFTRISVRISDRANGTTVWEGRADTQASSNAPASQPGLAADKLAAALFRDFPGVTGRTVTVQ
ncbi:DUF4136 domain-containing protein [Sphingomonas sp.]|uniref:DUF4136 domain-containing protein n=1 Tax=Sphingomonas sp. TaxID=28214 RepID=UPI0025E6C0F3|nr:DUF4136 domain-containing protein [Sphingomonas sp.]